MANILRTASIWLKGAIISFAIGLLLFVIGFATTSWVTYPYQTRGYYGTNGLWAQYYCTPGHHCTSYNYNGLNDYHRAIQAMECLALIGYILAVIILLLYLCADSCRRRDFLQGTTALTFAAILFACIGFALIGSRSNMENIKGYGGHIGWSMGLSIAGTVLYGLGGVFLIIQLIR